MFDSAAKYHNGEGDVTYGKPIDKSARKKILLMAMAQLRETVPPKVRAKGLGLVVA